MSKMKELGKGNTYYGMDNLLLDAKYVIDCKYININLTVLFAGLP